MHIYVFGYSETERKQLICEIIDALAYKHVVLSADICFHNPDYLARGGAPSHWPLDSVPPNTVYVCEQGDSNHHQCPIVSSEFFEGVIIKESYNELFVDKYLSTADMLCFTSSISAHMLMEIRSNFTGTLRINAKSSYAVRQGDNFVFTPEPLATLLPRHTPHKFLALLVGIADGYLKAPAEAANPAIERFTHIIGSLHYDVMPQIAGILATMLGEPGTTRYNEVIFRQLLQD